MLLTLKRQRESISNYCLALDILDLVEAIPGLLDEPFIPNIDTLRTSSLLGMQDVNANVGDVYEYYYGLLDV
jgi:hypothetical protein